MEDFKGKKVLFFTTNMDVNIVDTFKRMGAEIDAYSERPNQTFITRALIRINRKLISFQVNKYHQEILNETKDNHYDYIFFIRCEAFSRETISTFRAQHPKAKMVVFFWDSFNNNKNSARVYDLFDKAFCFEKEDSKRYGIQFKPLFYYDMYSQIKKFEHYKYKTLFIGTLHSDRYKVVHEIESQLTDMGHESFSWYFLPSHLLFYKMRLEDKTIKSVDKDIIKYSTLSLAQMVELYEQSEIIIDVQHPKQTGLTMRTFETLGAKRKLITTNKDIVNYDFYNPRNILVVDRDNIVIPKSFVEGPFEDLPEEVYNKYSLTRWLQEVIIES